MVENLEISNNIACGFNHRNIGLDKDCFFIASPWLKPQAMFEIDTKNSSGVTYISPLQGSVAYDKIIFINIQSRLDLVKNLEISNNIACGFNQRNIGLDTDCFLIVFPWLKPGAMFEN